MTQQDRLDVFRGRYANKTLTTGGVDWKYRALGGDSQPLLMLPGAELVNDMNFDLASALAARFRIVYPAYPRVQSLEDLADGAAAILRALRMPRAWVLGTSFGGAVAQLMVRRHQDAIERVVLSNSGVPLKNLVLGRQLANAALGLMPWQMLGRTLARKTVELLRAPAAEQPFWQHYARQLYEEHLTRDDVMTNLRIQLEYHQRYRFTPQDLANWRGKLFVIESENDIFSPARRKALHDVYPQATVHTFRDAGQAPAVSRPSEYIEVLGRFLS